MPTILLVDDDPHIREVLRFALDKAGYTLNEAADGKQALECFHQKRPDLVVLDIKMPEMDGTEVCRELRRESNVPIIFLSSKDEEIDRILGLELGGDDYVTKPFSPREVVARVRAVLRRVQEATRDEHKGERAAPLHHGLLQLDPEQYKVFWGDQEVVLTVTEFGLLRTMLQHPGKVFSRDSLMQNAYDFNNVVSGRTIDSHVRRIRAKFNAIGADPIATIHGVGYKIESKN